jgi:AAA domain
METLKRIKEKIESGDAIPDEFADLAELSGQSAAEPQAEPQEEGGEFGGEVFFPKPSNEEQLRVLDKITHVGGVLVQGPPGTGKSHTIANLICHLLATGQRILVTAKTPRALKVLEGLIPESIRPLCINLLGSGLEERKSLESSVAGILRKNEEWTEQRASNEQSQLEERLSELREERASTERRLRDIRESETHLRSIAGGAYRGTAARIAEMVNRDRNAYEWLTDAVAPDESCPITESDLRNLLESLRMLTPEKREELHSKWPISLFLPVPIVDSGA